MTNRELINVLEIKHSLCHEQWVQLFSTLSEDDLSYAMAQARAIAERLYGRQVYLRGTY